MEETIKKNKILVFSSVFIALVSAVGLVVSCVLLVQYINRIQEIDELLGFPYEIKQTFDEQSVAFQNYTHTLEPKELQLYELKGAELEEQEWQYQAHKEDLWAAFGDKISINLNSYDERQLLYKESKRLRELIHKQSKILFSQVPDADGSLPNMGNIEVSFLRTNVSKVRENTSQINLSLMQEQVSLSKYGQAADTLLMRLVIFSCSLVAVFLILLVLYVRLMKKNTKLYESCTEISTSNAQNEELMRELEESSILLQTKHTELVKTNTKNTEYAELLKQTLNIAKLSDWSYDASTDLFTFSKFASTILAGKDCETDLSLAQFLSYIVPEESKVFNLGFMKSKINHTEYIGVFRTRPIDGNAAYIRISAHHKYEQGQYIKSIGVIQDISYIKEKELQSNRLITHIDSLLELLPEVVAELDINRNVVAFNQKGVDLFGYSLEEVSRALNDGSIFQQEDFARFKENWERGVTGVQVFNKCNYTFITKTGKILLCEVATNYLFDEDDTFERAIAIIVDLTSELEIRAKMERKDNLLQQSCQLSNIGLFEHDLVADIHYWSPEIFSFMNLDRETVIPKLDEFYNIIHPDDRAFVSEQYDKLLNQGSYELECRILTQDKQLKYIQEWGKSVKNIEGEIIFYYGMVHDITEHVQQKNALAQINKKLLKVQHIAKIGYLEAEQPFDVQFTLNTKLCLSDEVVKMFELPPNTKSITFEDFMGYVPEDDKQRLIAIEDYFSHGKTRESIMDFRIITDFGVEKYLHMVRLLEYNDKEELVDFSAILQDVSDIRNMTVQLDAAKQEQSVVLASLSEMVFYFDKDANLTWANKKAYDYFGKQVVAKISLESFQILRDSLMFGERDKEKFNPVQYAIKQAKEVKCDLEYKDGNVLMAVAIPVMINKAVEGVVLSLNDITERMEIQKQLQTSEEKFRILAEQAAIGIFIFKNNTLIFGNKYLTDLLGYDIEEIRIDKNQLNIIDKKDYRLFAKIYSDIIQKKKESYGFRLRVICKNESVLFADISAKWVVLGDEDCIVGTLSDITALMEARRQAEEAESIKSNFLANISHEIRTPLNAIVGSAQLIAESYELMNATQLMDSSAMIESNATSLIYIINDMLVMANIESGSLGLKKENMNLNELVQELKTVFDNELKAFRKNEAVAILTYKPLSDSDAIYKGDYERIKQLLKHLLNNAVKFTEKGTISIGYNVEADNMLSFFVKDTGLGIQSQKIDEIHTLFHTVSPTLGRQHGGSGLGLPIVNSLVHMMGGKLSFKSEENKGATFYIHLPFEQTGQQK